MTHSYGSLQKHVMRDKQVDRLLANPAKVDG